jgi:hypothetical protein
VYCIEGSALAGLARQIVRDNGFENRIEVMANLAQVTQLPERCDVVISETLGFMALDEGFRAAMAHARDHYLKPGGRLLPASVALKVAAVEQTRLLPDVWSTPGVDGADLRRAIRAFSMVPRRTHVDAALQLSAPETLVELDCMVMAGEGGLDFSCFLNCHREGRLGGFIVWFEAELCDEVWLSSRSSSPCNHWGQGFLAAVDGTVVKAGDVLELSGSIADTPGRFGIRWSSHVCTADAVASA